MATAPLYAHGAQYAVDSAGVRQVVAADGAGRLRFTVDLGPSHAVQQYRFGAGATIGWRRTTVSIRRR